MTVSTRRLPNGAARLRNQVRGRLRKEIAQRPRARLALWDLRRRFRRNQDPASGYDAIGGKQLSVELALPSPPAGQPARLESLDLTTGRRFYVARSLAETGFGGYEVESLSCYLAMIDVAGPGQVLDVGANIGVYGLLAAALSDREVIAFEPTPWIAQAASDLATRNGIPMSVRREALGDTRTVATFYLSDRSDSSNSLAGGFRHSSHQLDVRVEPLDRLVRREGLAPAVIKVDTETTEPAVLRGAAKTIAEFRPWLLCEILAGRSEEALTAALEPFGYTWYHVVDEVPYTPTNTLAGDTEYKHLMWLFAPHEPPPEFWESVRAWRAALTSLPTPVQSAS